MFSSPANTAIYSYTDYVNSKKPFTIKQNMFNLSANSFRHIQWYKSYLILSAHSKNIYNFT